MAKTLPDCVRSLGDVFKHRRRIPPSVADLLQLCIFRGQGPTVLWQARVRSHMPAPLPGDRLPVRVKGRHAVDAFGGLLHPWKRTSHWVHTGVRRWPE